MIYKFEATKPYKDELLVKVDASWRTCFEDCEGEYEKLQDQHLKETQPEVYDFLNSPLTTPQTYLKVWGKGKGKFFDKALSHIELTKECGSITDIQSIVTKGIFTRINLGVAIGVKDCGACSKIEYYGFIVFKGYWSDMDSALKIWRIHTKFREYEEANLALLYANDPLGIENRTLLPPDSGKNFDRTRRVCEVCANGVHP